MSNDDNQQKKIDLIVQNNPALRPPDEITIEHVQAEPLSGNRRVRITVELTPFRERPNLEIGLFDHTGRQTTSTNAIAIMNVRTSYVLHLRGVSAPAGDYTVRVHLYYEDQPPQDTREIALTIPAANADSA